jgi:hypothetical protein
MSRDPRKPTPPEDDLLPPLPAVLDPEEDLVPLDPGAPEPVGELPFLETAFDDGLDGELSDEEPESTVLDTDDLGALLDPAQSVDLEDFATQEEIPALPWRLDVVLLELGRRVPAQLEPTLARTVLETPEPGPTAPVTLRIRMLDVPIELEQVAAPGERLRIGRDVLAGRILVRVD